MGGFYLYRGKVPIRALSAKDMATLVRLGYNPPLAEDIEDKSKGDWLSKGVALLQTIWFVAQCIARHVQHLSITQLEIVTLAYCTINITIYLCWYSKPLNVERPIRVDITLLGKLPEGFAELGNPQPPIVQKIASLVSIIKWRRKSKLRARPLVGGSPMSAVDVVRNDFKDLRPTHRPSDTFSGNEAEFLYKGPGVPFLIFSYVGIAFGSLHFIAWSGTFPSHTQHMLWHLCCVVFVTIPSVASGIGIRLSRPGAIVRLRKLLMIFEGMLALLYLFARVTTIVISLMALRYLEASATQSVQWPAWIPHFF